MRRFVDLVSALTPQERAQFESRYIQERRKVEQSAPAADRSGTAKGTTGADSAAEERVPNRPAGQKSRDQTGGVG